MNGKLSGTFIAIEENLIRWGLHIIIHNFNCLRIRLHCDVAFVVNRILSWVVGTHDTPCGIFGAATTDYVPYLLFVRPWWTTHPVVGKLAVATCAASWVPWLFFMA